ncbi:MAG TPA: DinB family protein [Candidatus Bathyarchaeia archaeon]|nr:DinB family protein [Candidatus Bathyarchaeia archaeon]
MPTVTEAVEALVRATVDLPDADMARPWVWREYDDEGLRFTLLMAQHELRDLAVRLAAMRPAPPSQAQRILGQYHHAYRDLTGALAGLRDQDLDRVPREGEWPLRDVLEHMLGAEYGFLSVIQYELAPDRPRDPKEAEERVSSWRDEHGYRGPKALEGSVADVRNALYEIHRRVLRELGGLSDADLERDAMFWDGAKPIRFRLHRFEAHMIQHTVQVDKTLVWIDRAPTEAKRLVRVLYRDLAAVEMLSSASFGQKERDLVATTIAGRAGEIAGTAGPLR